MKAVHWHSTCLDRLHGECVECAQDEADLAAERQWEAQEAQRHAESGMGDTPDGSES